MSTLRFAVVGDPVAHSASPGMHAAAYAALGLDCTYERIRATTAELPSVIARLRTAELAGLNVTIPHKRGVLSLVDRIDETARVALAANTLVRDEDGLVAAHNTDVPALAAELRLLAPDGLDWRRARALVLGTGGAGRAAVVALACHLPVAEVIVRGRAFAEEVARAAFHAEVTELLRDAGASSVVVVEPWAPSITTDREVSIIVQATSLGMGGGDPGAAAADVVAWSEVAAGSVALDVVYSNGMTPFVAAASGHGVRVVDGRGMLARQGALAFELWLHQRAPLDVMRGAL